ncbi:MAG: FAD-dependent oxidoreductase [Bacillota bacterium]
MKDTKKIVILGAGYAGVHAAKLLHKKYHKADNIEITLIDKNSFHTLMTDLHEIAGARVETETVKISLRKIFAGKKVEIVIDEIKDIDFKAQTLSSENHTYSYDYLILGTGAEPTFFGTKGAQENAFTIWSLDDAVKIREHVETMFEKASMVKDTAKAKELLTFTVVGAGFTGVEVIGELAEWKYKLCEEYGIRNKEVKLIIVEAMPMILPILDKDLQDKAERYMKELGIEIITNTPITEVGKTFFVLKDGTSIPCHTLIWTAGVQGSSFAAGLGLTMGKRNRVQTNEYLQSIDYGNVYVVGDNGYFEEEEGKGYPQIVEAALQTAETAVHNIEAAMQNASMKPFKSNFHGFMVSIGSRYAVANVTGMKLSGFFAMAVKHLVNLHYLFEVAGFMVCWHYLMHEFFHIRERRSILGGHFSQKSHAFWSVPLRLFVGYKWAAEGLEKLTKVLEDPSKIFLIPPHAKNTLSSAVTGIIQAAVDITSTATPLEETTSQFGQALPVPHFIDVIVRWSMGLLFYTADGGYTILAQIFQAAMVLGEIIVGLCLIAGLFTSLAAVVSVGMGLMIWASGMAPLEMLWYLAAGVALIGNKGKSFGLDYYIMPRLKHWWKKTRFAKKTYLYID